MQAAHRIGIYGVLLVKLKKQLLCKKLYQRSRPGKNVAEKVSAATCYWRSKRLPKLLLGVVRVFRRKKLCQITLHPNHSLWSRLQQINTVPYSSAPPSIHWMKLCRVGGVFGRLGACHYPDHKQPQANYRTLLVNYRTHYRTRSTARPITGQLQDNTGKRPDGSLLPAKQPKLVACRPHLT